MCGKGSSSGGGFGSLAPIQQSTTQASPQAIQAYTKALGLADVAAAQPFQQYSTDPNAFVAPLTGTQQQAIGGLYGAQGAYQPYYQGAGALTAAAGTTSTPQVVGQYMNPFMQQVVNPVQQALQQQQGQQLAQQQAEAIRGGAFGGERAGLQRQVLRGQQQLGMGQALSPLYQQGYGQALQAAQGDLGRQLQAGQALGALGTGAQTAALQAPQALLGAGTLEQQTQQAGLSALYNQFLQERAYPYQQAQFFSNIAGGLGPLLGQQTFQSQAQNPFGMFLSEPDAKMGVDSYADGGFAQDRSQPDVVGKTFDDQNIYAYRYKDGGPAHLGLMADEVQQAHPDAVGYAPTGDRMVDYAAATDAAARMGGAVKDTGDYARGGYAIGGHLAYVDPSDPSASDRRRMEALLASHKGGLSGAASEYGPSGQSYVTQKTYVPAGTVRAGQQLQHASFSPMQRQSGIGSALEMGEKLGGLLSKGYEAYDKYKVSKWPGWGGNEPSRAAGGLVPTSYIPEEITGEVRASQPLRPAEFAGREREESGLSKLMSVGEKALDAGIKYGPLLAKGATMLAAMSEPGMKTGVRSGYATLGGVRPANEDDIFEKGIIGAESRGRQFDREGRPLTSPAGAIGIAQVMPGTAPEAAKLAGLEYDPVRYRNDPEYNKALGRAYYNKQLETFGSEDKAAAAYNAGPGALQKALARAEREGGDYLSYLPAETRAYVPKVMGLAGARGEGEGIPRITPEAVSRARSGLGLDRMAGNFTPEQRRMMALDESSKGGLGAAKPKEEGGLGDYLTSEEFLIPALTGLGTAATTMLGAPTTSLGSAIGMGLGAGTVAGAQQVLPTRAKQAEIGKIGAETEKEKAIGKYYGSQAGLTDVEAIAKKIEAAGNAVHYNEAGNPTSANIYDPDTGTITWVQFDKIIANPSKYNLFSSPSSGAAQPAAPPSGGVVPPSESQKAPGQPAPLTGAAEQAVETAKTVTPGQPKEITTKTAVVAPGAPVAAIFSLTPEEKAAAKKATSELQIKDVRKYPNVFVEQRADLEGYNRQFPTVGELAKAWSKLPTSGGLEPGPLQSALAKGGGYLNTLLGVINKDPNVVNPKDLAYIADVQKNVTDLATQASQNAGQRSYAGLETQFAALPGGSVNYEGGVKNIVNRLQTIRKGIDKTTYYKQWNDEAGAQNSTLADFSGQQIDSLYNKRFNAMYEKERQNLEKMFSEPFTYPDPNDPKKRVTFNDPETGRPMSWANFIMTKGPTMDADEIKNIESAWKSPGILRYFPQVNREAQ